MRTTSPFTLPTEPADAVPVIAALPAANALTAKRTGVSPAKALVIYEASEFWNYALMRFEPRIGR
jgi:hypothetical protein